MPAKHVRIVLVFLYDSVSLALRVLTSFFVVSKSVRAVISQTETVLGYGV